MKKSIKSPEETNLNWKHWCELITSKIHILKYVLYVYVCVCSVMSDSFQPHGLQPARLLCPWNFSRQEYWSGLPFPTPEDLPNPGIEPTSSPLAGGFFTTSATWEAHACVYTCIFAQTCIFPKPCLLQKSNSKDILQLQEFKSRNQSWLKFSFLAMSSINSIFVYICIYIHIFFYKERDCCLVTKSCLTLLQPHGL